MEIFTDSTFWAVAWSVLGAMVVGFGAAIRTIKPLLQSALDKKKASSSVATTGDKSELYERLIEAEKRAAEAEQARLLLLLEQTKEDLAEVEQANRPGPKLLPAPAPNQGGPED